VPFPPGGVADTVGRPMAEAMGRMLGQAVIVENKAGAGGALGMAQVARAKPDGYTLLMGLVSISTIPVADEVLGRTPAFSLQQLTPIARVTADPTVLAVRADAPYKNYAEFERYVKANQGKLNYGHGNRSHGKSVALCLSKRQHDRRAAKCNNRCKESMGQGFQGGSTHRTSRVQF
ncbi:MAG: hypothetical protein EBW84_08525, partial [Betaproteobacteria bacterium]|nr:hypothetical protein [Betaproteobacteria bacterium]